jgi:addiction module HigA family antidote
MATNIQTPTPGDVLLDCLQPTGQTPARFAKVLGLPLERMLDIIHGHAPVTNDLALKLAQQLGKSAAYWLKLQAAHDRRIARS